MTTPPCPTVGCKLLREDQNWRRCAICGRYMSYDDLREGSCDITPDSEFGPEEISFTHKECEEVAP